MLGWPEERVLIVDPDDLPDHPQADQYVCLWIGDEKPEQPIIDGAGRIDARFEVNAYVTLRTRFSVDENSSAEKWLTEASLGHLRARHLIWDALLNFQPADANGNWLVVQPLVPGAATAPRKQKKHPDHWGESRVGFVITYEMDLTILGSEAYL